MLKRTLQLAILMLLLHLQLAAQNNLNDYFSEAYNKYPNIPKGILEAAAYSASHLANLNPHEGSDHANCMGMPERYGLFGLVEDGRSYFKNNLVEVCKLSNITPAQFKSDVRLQVLAVAKFLSQEAGNQKLAARTSAESFSAVLEKLSEIPNDGTAINTYARTLYTYDIYDHLQRGITTPFFQRAPITIQLEKIYPVKTLRTLRARGVNIDLQNDKIITPDGLYEKPSATPAGGISILSTDYGPALWDEAHVNNWGVGRNGSAITNVTIHTMQGSYAGTISWFNNGNQIVGGVHVTTSAHYLVRSSDGQITQMVRDANRAFHVLSANNYTIGIEHEGFVNDASWYTNNMYNSSALLVRDICSSWTIDKTACFPGPATSGVNVQPITVRIKGHQHYSGNSHTDPGINWNWTKYKGLINPPVVPLTRIAFAVKDQATGLAIASASVTVTKPDATTSTVTTNASGILVYSADSGKYSFSFAKTGYTTLKTSFTGGVAYDSIAADINMDPVTTLAKTTPVTTGMLVDGYVSDADANGALRGVQISVGNYSAVTDSKGYFSIAMPAKVSATPQTVSIRSSKAGYRSHTIQNFQVIPDGYTLKIALARNDPNARLAPSEEVEVAKHGLFDGKGQEVDDARVAGLVTIAADATVPASIRILTSCACTGACNTVQVQVMSLEAYVQTGLDDEWLSSWNAASLQAGAVAYRSRGAWYVQHPVAVNHDLTSATCHQTWQNDRAVSVKNAAIATKGIVLVRNGEIVKAEYAAENNNAGCGDGFSGNSTTWPCISDARCVGRANNGHGRGMCQWGSSFWGTDQTYTWILNHYYNPDSTNIQLPTLAAARTTEKMVSDVKLQLSPNPVTNGEVTVTYLLKGAPQAATILLSDNVGGIAQQKQVALQQGSNRFTLQTGHLRAGIYIVSVRLQLTGTIESKKLVLVK